jgi:hypothetical protein
LNATASAKNRFAQHLHRYLEEAYFWANYCLLDSWPHPRQNERGILAGQIRGDAWGLRNLADAA